MAYEVKVVLLFLAATTAGFIVPFGVAWLWQRQAVRELAVILLSLSLVGACAGMAGGMSRVGAVGSIIPAFLGLLGGLSVYLFGVDRTKGLIVSFGAVAMSLSLLLSYSFASNYRNIGDDHRDIRSRCAAAYTDQKLLSDAVAFAAFRKQLGTLCDASMYWEIAD